ncbi:MAG: anthranilate phosphoribosyltransferase [Gammaproteobacteria bacterium]|nr:anthranilate phosphoribosyltransferase [Gammaproteobacteria bacterium]NNF60169.1 anthranilate phosphoribosyltransferase [Gammaproteobacteria bacterium]NNM21582.1 anthranilate phosphoribosyltransferase [Gammaproteobacteria bacterium]
MTDTQRLDASTARSDEAHRVAKQALADLLDGVDLEQSRAAELMHALTEPTLHPALAGGVLVALRQKGETAAEIRGFANTMRELAVDPQIPPGAPAVDCVGTGGDGSGSFNISTGAALLAAAAGVRVIKHGNRAVSSKSGSADVLEALGLPLPLNEQDAVRCLDATSFTFLFAPFYHPAMKSIAPVRGAMAVRTVFNLLGPLSNPARPPFGVIGAYSPEAARLMADTLAGMEIQRVFVVHGEPGWDEATPVGPFQLYDVRPGRVHQERRDPHDYKIERCAPEQLAGGDAAHNAEKMTAVFHGELGPHYDALTLGAALLLEVSGAASGRRASLAHVRESINTGRAATLLKKLKGFGDSL